MTGRIPLDRIMLAGMSHVCLVVPDLKRTAQRFSRRFNIGPFTIRTVVTPASRGLYRGEPSRYSVMFGYAQSGAVVLELAQPLEGRSHVAEFLEKRGTGLHHLGFSVGGELDRELDRWRQEGVDPLQVHRRDDTRYGWAYMDTEDLVGCVLEVVCDPPLGWWDYSRLLTDLQESVPDSRRP